jgi:hypothetical protein
MIDALCNFINGTFDRLDTFLPGGKVASTAKVVVAAGKGKFALSPAFVATATKAAMVFGAVSCMACGFGLAAKAWTRSWSVRGAKTVYIPPSLRPQVEGQHEEIAGPVRLLTKIKTVFFSKIAVGAVGLAAMAGGAFMLFHAPQFVKALRK